MRPILSIIIPYYNAEQTINRTLVSINNLLKNTAFEYEVIVVDDGSVVPFSSSKITDCEFICTSYRIENHGPLFARCFGLKKAKGEYIFFLDADDELRNTFFVDFCDSIEQGNPDVILVDFYKKGDAVFEHTNRPQFIDDQYYCKHLAGIADLGFAASQIFKKRLFSRRLDNFVKNNKVRFSEDLLFWLNLFERNRTYSLLNRPAYIYNFNKNSVSSSYNEAKITDIVYVLNQRFEFIKENDDIYNHDSFFADVIEQICYLRKVISLHILKTEKKACKGKLLEISFLKNLLSINFHKLTLENKLFLWIIKHEYKKSRSQREHTGGGIEDETHVPFF